MKYTKEIRKWIIKIIVIMIMITGCSIESNNVTSSNKNQDTVEEPNNKSDQTHNKSTKKKVYKVAGDEYHNYIKETVKKVVDNNNGYSLGQVVPNYPYINIYINYANEIDENTFNNINNELAKQLFTEFKKSKFKGNIGYEYNVISLYFKGKKINCSEIICEMNKNIQIDVLEISDYKSYSEYINK